MVNGWIEAQLKDISSMKSGNTITEAKITTLGRFPCYGGNGLRGYTTDYTHNGEFALIGRQGALCGNVVAVDGMFFASEHAIVVTPKENIYIRFLTYVLKNIGLSQYSESSAQPGLSVQKILGVSCYIPQSLPEQRLIAALLSDTDELIAALEKLIAKKRNIKQGAMQELLTGERRLPGFSSGWVEMNLAANSSLKARIGWQGLTTAEYLNDGYAYLITGTDFSNGKIHWATCHYVDKYRFDQDINIQVGNGDILITKDGTIGKVAIVNNLNKKATLNSGVFVVRPKNNAYDRAFIYHILQSEIFTDFLAQLAAGSTINHLYQKDFVGFVFFVPPTIKEQTSIASILSDMDAEIDALAAKLTKLKQIKQGMMSELLTGRIRLTESDVRDGYAPILEEDPLMLKVAESQGEYKK